jgi:hypothetical protein
MKSSDRLKLMRLISDKLKGEQWSIINLTLEQFRLPIARSPKGNPDEYVLRQISKADDEILEDLAAHLEIASPEGNTREEISFWKEGTIRLFISHLSRKKTVATELRDELDKFGISGFVAHADITPSREWQNEIEKALRTCDCLVALMASGFHKSDWTDHEVGFVFGKGLPIIPVNMGEHPYGFIAKFQAYKFHDTQKLTEIIFKLLLTDKRTAKKMSYAVVHKFENSNSFASSAQNLRLLKKIKYWDNSMMERIKLAVQNNNQIKGSFDVPEGVKSLLKKLKSKVPDRATVE